MPHRTLEDAFTANVRSTPHFDLCLSESRIADALSLTLTVSRAPDRRSDIRRGRAFSIPVMEIRRLDTGNLDMNVQPIEQRRGDARAITRDLRGSADTTPGGIP